MGHNLIRVLEKGVPFPKARDGALPATPIRDRLEIRGVSIALKEPLLAPRRCQNSSSPLKISIRAIYT